MKKWDVQINISTAMKSDFGDELLEQQLTEFVESFGLGGKVTVFVAEMRDA